MKQASRMDGFIEVGSLNKTYQSIGDRRCNVNITQQKKLNKLNGETFS